MKLLAEKNIHGNVEFEFTGDGLLKNYLGVESNKQDDGTMQMKQEFLIE